MVTIGLLCFGGFLPAKFVCKCIQRNCTFGQQISMIKIIVMLDDSLKWANLAHSQDFLFRLKYPLFGSMSARAIDTPILHLTATKAAKLLDLSALLMLCRESPVTNSLDKIFAIYGGPRGGVNCCGSRG